MYVVIVWYQMLVRSQTPKKYSFRSLKNKNMANLLLFTKNQKYGMSIAFLVTNLNQGYIYIHDIKYIIKKFWMFATSNGYLYLEDSNPRKTKKIQNTTANTICQNLATKPIVT